MAKDFGDFQTPPLLVSEVLQCLINIGSWPRAFEPTCGSGNFIAGLLNLPTPPHEIQGVELQEIHFTNARKIGLKPPTRLTIHLANLFDLDLREDIKWRENGPLLVVGNPPWVTNAELSVLGSKNLPQKTNLKGLRGMEAITGDANFDLAESIWLKLIKELAPEQPTIALLCKTSVARNVLKFASDAGLPISGKFIRRINAQKWFNAAVDACLFCVEVGAGRAHYEAPVYKDLFATEPESVLGLVKKRLVTDIRTYTRSAFADGICPFTWRQGIKHDASPVMELTYDSQGDLQNKFGEKVFVEPEYIYPLLKSSDLFNQKPPIKRAVIVTQKRLGENTERLRTDAPLLWSYLSKYRATFEGRKSSIYDAKPLFAMFGIGEYSFAPYKVGISGLYKTPRFRSVGPVSGRPVMLDDTCYFIACRSPEQAALLTGLLNDPICLDVIQSFVFADAKRPITKKVLQRIDLKAILSNIDRHLLLARAKTEIERLNVSPDLLWPSNLEGLLEFEAALF